MITAGGNVKCRYLQDCRIRAEGNIYADTIMYCTLECDGDVEMNGKRSILVGGRSYIAGVLTAKGIGTESNTATYIKMCASSMAKKRELDELEGAVKHIDGEISKIVQVLSRFEDLQKQDRLTPEHIQTIQSVKDSYIALSGQRGEKTAQIEALKKAELDVGAAHSYVRCSGRIHTGVRFTFGPLIMNVSNPIVNSRVGIVDGDISVAPL
jgi:uncharacterized protein (DUF342 family)